MDCVYLNGRFLTHQIDGIGRFSLELCKQLKAKGIYFKIVVPQWFYYENKEEFNIVKFGRLKSHLWEQIDLFRFLRKHKSPFLLNLSGLGPVFYKNQIITIHDLSFFANPRWFSKSYTLLYKIVTPIVAKSAKRIITVSEFSKTEIVKYLKLPSKKIFVINNAVATNVSLNDKSTEGRFVEDKYILAVSSIDPRKNLQRLINVFAEQELSNVNLILVGKKAKHFNVSLKSIPENVTFTGYVSDDTLKNIYQNCEFFIYPSLYEGFGIPPLEAMSNNCAVIAGDIPSLKEVCGSAAVYVNPYDETDIKNAIFKFLKNKPLVEEMKIRGRLKVSEYSWTASGDKLIHLLKVHCENSPNR